MTTAAEDGDGRRYAWMRRHTGWMPGALMWTGHYALWMTIPYIVLTVISDVTGQPGWLTWVLAPAIVLFYGSVIIDSQYHHARLCGRCFAAAPLDPQAAVDKWRPVLRADHKNRMILAILGANFLWSVLIGSLLVDGVRWAGLPAHHAAWAYLLHDLPVIVIVISYWVMARKHRDLYPWCPWCHWRDGGDEEEIPDPDPEDHGVKPVPA
jgi:hypothetical protein